MNQSLGKKFSSSVMVLLRRLSHPFAWKRISKTADAKGETSRAWNSLHMGPSELHMHLSLNTEGLQKHTRLPLRPNGQFLSRGNISVVWDGMISEPQRCSTGSGIDLSLKGYLLSHVTIYLIRCKTPSAQGTMGLSRSLRPKTLATHGNRLQNLKVFDHNTHPYVDFHNNKSDWIISINWHKSAWLNL